MKQPSLERVCAGKTNLGRRYAEYAERLKTEYGKDYGVYRCPYCGGTHLTTKLINQENYEPLLYSTASSQ
jgi:rubrerythrin